MSIFVRLVLDSSVSFWITLLNYFPLVISVFFYDYFRVPKCFMLRSETNSTRFTTIGMRAKKNAIHAWCKQAIKSDCGLWSLLLLAATVRSFARLLLGLFGRNMSEHQYGFWPNSSTALAVEDIYSNHTGQRWANYGPRGQFVRTAEQSHVLK